MTSVPFVSLLIALLISLSGPAQTRDGGITRPGTAVLGGVVTDGTKPLRRATVSLRASDVVTLQAITDDSGRFTFLNLPAGRYTLSASRLGYVTSEYGASKPGRPGSIVALADGQRLTNLSITMPRGSVVTGMITTEMGEPARDVRVTALTVGVSPTTGERQLTATGFEEGAKADDRGAFRIYGLPPGNYVVLATGLSRTAAVQTTEADYQRAMQMIRGGASAGAAAPVPPKPPATASAPIFFPGTLSASDAQVVTVGAGEERSGINFAVRTAPTARIDGTLTGPDGQAAANVPITIVSPDRLPGPLGILTMPGRPVSDGNGRFTIPALLPGRHTLVARANPGGGRGTAGAAPDLWAMIDIVVDGRDQSVQLSLRPGVTVSGKVLLDSSGTSPTDPSGISLQLQAVLGASGIALGVPNTTPDASGAFSFSGVTPGRYRFLVVPPAAMRANPVWFLKSVQVEGRGLDETPIEVATTDTGGVTITVTDRPSELAGIMQDASGQPAPEYFLILFSKDTSHWVPQSTRIQQVRPSTDGKYTFRGLPPGEYLLAAVTDVQPGEWFDRTYLSQIAPSAIPITLVEGVRKVQDIRVK